MKKLLPLALALILLLSACGTNASDSFNNYLDKSDTYSNRELPSGATIKFCKLQHSGNKFYTVLDFTPYFDDTNTYAWAALTPKEQKEDMKYMADMVMNYAIINKWDNDYYLFIAFEAPYASFVYDYETDTLHYPNNIGVYRLMYKEFSTMDAQELLGNELGEAFLVKYGLAEIKHKKVELFNSHTDPIFVRISNGSFVQSGMEFAKSY